MIVRLEARNSNLYAAGRDASASSALCEQLPQAAEHPGLPPRFAQRGEKALRPALDVIGGQMRVHPVLALPSLLERHFGRSLDRLRHPLRLVRIDDHRAVQLLCDAGEL